MKNFILFIFCVLNYTVNAQQWQWAYHVSTNYGSAIAGVQTDSAGNPCFMGWCSDTTVFNGQNGSFPTLGLNEFITKYDASGNIKWVSGGWGSSIQPSNMSIDKHSNCFLTGQFGGTVSFGKDNDTLQRTASSQDYYLVKLDKDGKAVFFNSDGGTCSDVGTSVTTFSSDEIIVFWIDETTCSRGGGSWINHFNKLNSNGTLIWSLPQPNVTFGEFAANQISPTMDGGFLLSDDWFGNTLCCYGITDTLCLVNTNPNGTTDVFLTKYSLSGVLQWVKSIRGNNNQFERCVTTDSSNNIIIAIEGLDTTYYDSTKLFPKGNRTTYIIKTDALGTLIKYISFPTASNTEHFLIKDLKTDSQGNIYLLVSTDTNLYIGNDSILFNLLPNQTVFVLIKLDPNMNYLWSQYAFQNNNSYGSWHGLMTITDSLVYLGVDYNTPVSLNGSNYQFPAPKNSTRFDSFFAAIKNGNNACSHIHYQNRNICTGQSVKVGSNIYSTNGIYKDILISVNGCDSVITTNLTVNSTFKDTVNITINKGDSIKIGNSIYNSIGTYINTFFAFNGCDSIVTTNLSVLTGISENTSLKEIIIYPNPTTGICTISLNKKIIDSKICVYDLLGNCLLNKVCSNDANQNIDLSSQSKGIYFMEILADGEKVVKKIVLQ